jgi:V8-like Glu-specific endopeptidase
MPLAKTIDSTHNSVVAFQLIDTSGKVFVGTAGVLIHPKIILTAGHVNYNVAKKLFVGLKTQGFVATSYNAYNPDKRYPVNLLRDIESYPDTADYQKSFSDTTGEIKPTMFIDIGLIFLDHPISNMPIAKLPKPFLLNDLQSYSSLLGVGFGYDKATDSTFSLSLVDGLRRKWTPHKITLFNDLWLSAQCDTISNLPFISIGDSGAPLFQQDSIVVGIWSFRWDTVKPCPYSSWAVRVDNSKVLTWIKDTIKSRLGIDL